MIPGQVIAVVGPSGVGKDSVMAGLSTALPALQIVRRTITRPAELGGEDYNAVTLEAFAAMIENNAFCLHWTAHGLSYGIPMDVKNGAFKGQSFLVNLSRGILPTADQVFPNFAILRWTASPETLARRLQGRGRETPDDIRARLAHTGASIPSDLRVIDISNDGPLLQTVAAAAAALCPRPALQTETQPVSDPP